MPRESFLSFAKARYRIMRYVPARRRGAPALHAAQGPVCALGVTRTLQHLRRAPGQPAHMVPQPINVELVVAVGSCLP